jgi:hypothetical protein
MASKKKMQTDSYLAAMIGKRLQGNVEKMKVTPGDPVHYAIRLSGRALPVNEAIGHELRITFSGRINCVSCGVVVLNPVGQGFCAQCFATSPEASECIMRPELCRAHVHEGRDVEWEEQNHNQPHVVYLAVSGGLKVGVTRETQVPVRWIDQGAERAMVIARVPYRMLAGAIEVFLKNHLSDKTNWQRMLKNQHGDAVLERERQTVHALLRDRFGEYLDTESAETALTYPVLRYPDKVKSTNLQKQPEVSGVLEGIRGQYLLFSGGQVLNLRNHAGYHVQVEF